MRELQKQPRLSASKLTTILKEATGKEVTPQNIRNMIRNQGYHSHMARNKPYISKINKQKRLDFVDTYYREDETFFIFVDKSKYNVFGNDGKEKVWRKPNTELQCKNVNTTVKHGGGSVMV